LIIKELQKLSKSTHSNLKWIYNKIMSAEKKFKYVDYYHTFWRKNGKFDSLTKASKQLAQRNMLAPKVLGLVFHVLTKKVVCTHSIGFRTPKEMKEEFHRVCIRPSFVSSTPSAKTTNCASVQVFSIMIENKKMLT
jgi:hypothetical protein